MGMYLHLRKRDSVTQPSQYETVEQPAPLACTHTHADDGTSFECSVQTYACPGALNLHKKSVTENSSECATLYNLIGTLHANHLTQCTLVAVTSQWRIAEALHVPHATVLHASS
eukprot:6138936-Amphidinium_carterae.1